MVDFETTTLAEKKVNTTSLFEPDFQPVKYNTANFSSIFDTPEYEIEQDYSDYAKVDESNIKMPSFDSVFEDDVSSHGETEIFAHGDREIFADKQSEISAHGETEIFAKSKNETSNHGETEIYAMRNLNSRPKLNARGRILVSVYSIIVAIILAFSIYSGVMINRYSAEIAAKTAVITRQEDVINNLTLTYNSLGESDTIAVSATEFQAPTSANTTHISGFEMVERTKTETPTNWFQQFCENLRKLFS